MPGRAGGRSGGAAGAPARPLWQEAVSFALRRHAHQKRRDGRTPYAAHVVRVAFTVAEVFGCHDETVLAAALLHDTIEDTTTDYDDVAERFGTDVADLVAALTKDMTLPEAPREQAYDRRLARSDWRARLIKLADAYDNLADSENDPRQAEHLAKRLEACDRAIALAVADRDPCSRRAVEAVAALRRSFATRLKPRARRANSRRTK